MARPKKDITLSRTKRFPNVRCTNIELATLQSRAAQSGMIMGTFIRHRTLIGGDIISYNQSPLEQALVYHLKTNLGDWLNTLTHRANSTGIFPQALTDCLKGLEPVLDHVLFSISIYDTCVGEMKNMDAAEFDSVLIKQLKRVGTNLVQLVQIANATEVKPAVLFRCFEKADKLLDRFIYSSQNYDV